MEFESRQAEVLEGFCLLARSARGRAAAQLVAQATAEPRLFAFGELLDQPHVQELEDSEHSAAFELLKLFAYGTWSQYKSRASTLPALQPQQALKLKQLTVITLAESAKVLPYDLLMAQLDITNVRELEDMLINDCMYAGIIRGKLDQQQRCLEVICLSTCWGSADYSIIQVELSGLTKAAQWNVELQVHSAAGRDLRPGQVESLLETLGTWLSTAEELLVTIQDKIHWADAQSAAHWRHRKEVEDAAEEVKNVLKSEAERGQSDLMYGDSGPSAMDYVEEDRSRPKRWQDLHA
eukprot:SM000047S16905  [mRNA]  locus=s47:638320:640886:- [translate_table: standard]